MRTGKIGPGPSLAPSPTCPFNSGQFVGGKMNMQID